MEVNKKQLLVLDLDSTLIWSSDKEIPDTDVIIILSDKSSIWVKKRPNLDIFLDYCFDNYDIGVFSAASKEYVNAVCNYIFKDKLIIFIMSGERCTEYFQWRDGDYQFSTISIKKLLKIWQIKRWNYNNHNTLIIDDTAYTYIKNYGNAIPIIPYLGNKNDNELVKMIYILKIVKDKFDVRKIDKRKLYNEL